MNFFGVTNLAAALPHLSGEFILADLGVFYNSFVEFAFLMLRFPANLICGVRVCQCPLVLRLSVFPEVLNALDKNICSL